jgi:CHAT domain-containing protein
LCALLWLTLARGRHGVTDLANKLSLSGCDLLEMAIPLPLSPLPLTEGEAQDIARLFPAARLLLGPSATEAAVKQVRHPEWLHIAMHGGFFDVGAVAGDRREVVSHSP